MRTELLKLQITSPWCESRECWGLVTCQAGLWWWWYRVSGSGSQWQSLWTMECPLTSHSIHQPSLVTLCISRHLTSASWHSLQHSAVCSGCSLFTIGHRVTAELLGLQVSGQYAAYGQQWLIMSESCHRYIIRSRRILVRSITPCLHLCILYSVFSHDERVH